MPGITSECDSGLHQACPDKTCRCPCHPWTQDLLKTPAKTSDPTGGIRRTLPPELAPAPQLHNTCPKCGRSAKTTDVFCRNDGERLLLGKQCLGCGAPQEPQDEYCWQCALKTGEKPTPLPTEEKPEEDRISRILREAREKGVELLKETTV